MKKNLLFIVSLMLILILAACGNNDSKEETKAGEAKTEGDSHYPVTIKNYKLPEGGKEWEENEQTFDKAPERILANTRPAAEILLHLGLGDKIVGVGASSGIPDKAVEEEYAKLNILSEDYISKEVALGPNPDFIYGRGGLFSNAEWGVGTVDSLNDMGINTFVLESSITDGTYESIYKDIENLGEIFNVEDKAESFIKQIKEKQNSVTSKLANIKENKTFAYLHMNDPKEISIYPASSETFFNDAFNMINLENVFKDATGEVGVEALIEADPDVLIIPSFEKKDEVMKALYSNPKLSSMKAIKDKQIFAVEYNYLFGYGYNTIDGMETLAKEIYPDVFK